jgi:hypothetical protein
MRGPALIRASLSKDTLIMMIMCVLVVRLLCQVLMGWVLVLEGLLASVHRC